MRAPFYLVTLLLSTSVHALGNHPEANTCSAAKPYYAVCTAGSHDLQGWVGACYATREEAQHAADEHARKAHGGNMQWTGIARTSGASGYGGDRSLPP